MLETTSAKTRLMPKTVKNLRSMPYSSPPAAEGRFVRIAQSIAVSSIRYALGISATHAPSVIAGAYGIYRTVPLSDLSAFADPLQRLRK
jgi:hypothetical protein